MKLLLCDSCHDVVRLYTHDRSCHCGRSRGRYVTDTIVRLHGPCRAIGIDTGDLVTADNGTWHVSERVQRGGME